MANGDTKNRSNGTQFWSLIVVMLTLAIGLSGGLLTLIDGLRSGINLQLEHMAATQENTRNEFERRFLHIEVHVDENGHPKTTNQSIEALTARLTTHEGNGHPAAGVSLASLHEKFTEVETQFRASKDDTDRRFEASDATSGGRHDLQEEKIKALIFRLEQLEDGGQQ